MKKVVSLFVGIVLIMGLVLPAAAASSNKAVTSSSTMSLTLSGGKSGTSSYATFNMNAIPAGAVVTKVVVKGGVISASGLGAISSPTCVIKNNAWGGSATTASWKPSGSTTITTGVIGKEAAGTWTLAFNGTNVGSSVAMVSNARPTVTVYYNY